jgi:hypothetical protein
MPRRPLVPQVVKKTWMRILSKKQYLADVFETCGQLKEEEKFSCRKTAKP